MNINGVRSVKFKDPDDSYDGRGRRVTIRLENKRLASTKHEQIRVNIKLEIETQGAGKT